MTGRRGAACHTDQATKSVRMFYSLQDFYEKARLGSSVLSCHDGGCRRRHVIGARAAL